MSENSDAPDIESIDFYWRPGCPFCSSLNRSLEKLEIPMNKLNIWDDPQHAAYVRSVADGNETVPTVTVGDVSMVNPNANQVLAAMAEQAPHLVPEGADTPEPNPVGRLVNRLLGGN